MSRMIIGYCWGAAGSRWLARFMNAHPDVWFTHGYPPPVARDPGMDHLADKDVCLRYLSWMNTTSSHPYVGLTHRVRVEWHEDIKALGQPVRAFVLIRHPVLRIRSIMGLDANNPKRMERPGAISRVQKAERKLGGSLDGSFLSSCELQSAAMRDFNHDFPVITIEELGTVDGAESLMAHCYNLDLEMGQQGLIGFRVGVHAGGNPTPQEVWEGWPEEWRQAYDKLVSVEVRKALRGYYEWVP